ncbi:CUB and sushi domain-containing protein 3-like [Mercenaria mercenaria]|uniref:CUB and sushi domain-containing protein 3-like n=1 Tax=Mercenaria mercenaria TaxID=6596 RepID=UPI00234E88CD|nr:CUB and sushi domain-containing protein 3-like [Mercenaria mercenaria]
MLGIGLSDCVRECGLRPHCEALSYMGRMQMCDLFSTTDEGNLPNGECMYISGSYIKFEKTPCGICSYGQVCDMPSKQCKYKECISTRINNGTVLGNLNEVGSKIRYKCNHGYRDKNGIISAVCKEDGTWNVTANCTRDCGNPVSPANGTIVSNSGTMFLDTATVTCDDGYQSSVGVISCTASGQWDTVTCDRICKPFACITVLA